MKEVCFYYSKGLLWWHNTAFTPASLSLYSINLQAGSAAGGTCWLDQFNGSCVPHGRALVARVPKMLGFFLFCFPT